MSSSYRLSLENWLKSLVINTETVIDIGGSQLPVKNRVKGFKCTNYYVLDLAMPHKVEQKPDGILDLNSGDSKQEASGFIGMADVLFCLEVMEYVYRPEIALNWINKLLKPNGTAYVTFPFIYPTHQPVEDDCLRYTLTGIQKLAYITDLEIISVIPRRPETDQLLKFFSVERLRAAKGYDHNVLGWIVELRRVKK
jgi:SAM-dependent methyltransferase